MIWWANNLKACKIFTNSCPGDDPIKTLHPLCWVYYIERVRCAARWCANLCAPIRRVGTPIWPNKAFQRTRYGEGTTGDALSHFQSDFWAVNSLFMHHVICSSQNGPVHFCPNVSQFLSFLSPNFSTNPKLKEAQQIISAPCRDQTKTTAPEERGRRPQAAGRGTF
jgi:hypothetical protein